MSFLEFRNGFSGILEMLLPQQIQGVFLYFFDFWIGFFGFLDRNFQGYEKTFNHT